MDFYTTDEINNNKRKISVEMRGNPSRIKLNLKIK